jgi:hypothetical protein
MDDSQRFGISQDRLLIRRQVVEKLMARGIDPNTEIIDMDDYWDEESILRNNEASSWSVREASLQDEVVEDNDYEPFEGLDSMSLAIKAHASNSTHSPGRSRSMAWSDRQNSTLNLLNTQNRMMNMNRFTDWTSFKVTMHAETPIESDLPNSFQNQSTTKDGSHRLIRWHRIAINVAYVGVALGATVAFAIYIEILKIQSFS